MGFFASRWIEKHGAASEKAALQTTFTTTTTSSSLAGLSTSGSEGAGTVKAKWFSRKPKDVQINPPQANQPRGTPNGSQLRQRNSFTDGLAQRSYGTWSGPPPLLSPAVSTTRSTFAPATDNSASVYSYTVASGPSREQVLQRAAGRGPTDTVTATLGQQLEALAAANADGLLDDNAYRLLRQDLFQRFGPLAGQIPAEPGMVKMSLPSMHNINDAAASNPADPSLSMSPTLPKGDSNFTVSKSSRSIRSTHSKASSVTTAVTSLFRRVSSHAHHPSNTSGGGAGSIVSGRTSSAFDRSVAPRTLVHKASNGSFVSGAGSGSVLFDGRSISSRRTGRSTAPPGSTFVHDPLSSVGAGLSRSTTRSTRGPPSSYHRRHAHGGGGGGSGQGSDEDGAGRSVPDDWTAAEIRTEIASIEEEMHRVRDMLRGLEVSRLVKAGVAGPGRTVEGEDERAWTVVAGGGSQYYANSGGPRVRVDAAASGGAVKRRSGVFGSKLGRKGSLGFLRRPPPPLPPLPTPNLPTPNPSMHPPSLPTSHPSSYASPAPVPKHVPTLMSLPPTTPLTTTSHPSSLTVSPAHTYAHAQAYPVVPSLAPSRSSPHLPLARWGSLTQLADGGSSAEGEGGGGSSARTVAGLGQARQMQSDIEEVRRKRADVEARYEKRLEYLRARLKAAEIHERLLR